MEAIRTLNLCKKYGNKNVVNNLNLTVPEGAVYGFIGRNGAGKSTTQKMVCGLTNATSGNVKLFGKALDDVEARRCIGTLIEEPGFYAGFSALKNMMLQAENIGIKNPKEKAMEALKEVGLEKFKDKKAKHLSLGMKQRLGLAMAMLGNPKLLILDEPINGLDPEGIVQIREVIEKINKKGVTIFISSHILGELSKIATHYGILKDGELVEQITAQELSDKRKKTLTIKVKDAQTALELLINNIHIEHYTLVSNEEIHIMDTIDTASINRILYSNDCDVIEIFNHQQDLDEYFIQLMGGNNND